MRAHELIKHSADAYKTRYSSFDRAETGWFTGGPSRITSDASGAGNEEIVRAGDKASRIEERPTVAGSHGFLTTRRERPFPVHADKHELAPNSWRKNVLPRRSYGAVAEEIFA